MVREKRDLKRLGFEGSEERRIRATALREVKRSESRSGFTLILVRRRRRLRAQVLKIRVVASMAKSSSDYLTIWKLKKNIFRKVETLSGPAGFVYMV